MKIFVGSDIHGSAPMAQKFLAEVQRLSPADGNMRIVILGDVYNHGPRNPLPEGYAPMQVAAALNAVKDKLSVVKGNCDSEVDAMISEFSFYNSVSIPRKGKKLIFTHGHKINADMPMEGLEGGDAVFYGHFHKPQTRVVDGVRYVCVGAIGMSAAGVPRSYAVISDDGLDILSLEDGSLLEHIDM